MAMLDTLTEINVWVLAYVLSIRYVASEITKIKHGSIITLEALSRTQEWALFGFESL